MKGTSAVASWGHNALGKDHWGLQGRSAFLGQEFEMVQEKLVGITKIMATGVGHSDGGDLGCFWAFTSQPEPSSASSFQTGTRALDKP